MPAANLNVSKPRILSWQTLRQLTACLIIAAAIQYLFGGDWGKIVAVVSACFLLLVPLVSKAATRFRKSAALKAAALTMVIGLLIAAAVSAAHYRYDFKFLSYSLFTSAAQKAKEDEIIRHINLFHPELWTKDEYRIASSLVSEEGYWQRKRRESLIIFFALSIATIPVAVHAAFRQRNRGNAPHHR